MGRKVWGEGREETAQKEGNTGTDQKAEPVEERTDRLEKDKMEFLRGRPVDNINFSRRDKKIVRRDQKDHEEFFFEHEKGVPEKRETAPVDHAYRDWKTWRNPYSRSHE